MDIDPYDEKEQQFRTAYQQAKRTDTLYLSEIEALLDEEEASDERAQIERRLKDRVREQLRMPAVKDLKPLSNAEWARQHNLDPHYDLPLPKAEDTEIGKKPAKHSDDWMQTLHLPQELEQKLQGLKRYISTDINETGVNTFYVAFGFLQWYDKEDADKPCLAPLMLLQVDPMTEKKTKNGEVFYAVEASGEDPQYNLPLAERLKEFGLALPELDMNDTPESYMQKVEGLIKNKPKWRVRRFVTIGRFQFARLVMYPDLDPNKWPQGAAINDNPLIKGLLSGHTSNYDSSDTGGRFTYDIDTDPKVEEAAPILITEADSSQHSAIVDALKGSNLIIKGPPGTGKSQTITNVIVNSLAKNKRVLFIAEKIAALNVVYSRLKRAGLGDFCLELHSTKSKLKNIRDNLATCLANRRSVSRPRALPEKIKELKNAKHDLRQYSDILHQPFGSTGKTIYDILWAEQARRHVIASQPAAIKGLRIKNASAFTLPEIDIYREELKRFEELSSENSAYTPATHPWKGVGMSQVSGLKISEIIQAAEEALDVVNFAVARAGAFEEVHGWNPGGTFDSFEDCRRSWIEVYECKTSLGDANFELLSHLTSRDAISEIEKFISNVENYQAQAEACKETIKNLVEILPKQDELKALCKHAEVLGIDKLSAKQIRQHVEKLEQTRSFWEQFEPKLSFVSWKILGKENPTIKEITLIIEAMRLLRTISRKSLLRRSEETLSDSSLPVLSSAIDKQKSILAFEDRLKSALDVNTHISEHELDRAIYELSEVNIFSYFKSDFYQARKTYKSLRLSKGKIDYELSAQVLRGFRQYRSDLTSFNADWRYGALAGKFFEGIATDFAAIRDLNTWAQDVRQSFASSTVTEEKLKAFLLTGPISDIDAVLSQLPSESVDIIKAATSSFVNKDVTCKEYVANQMEIVRTGSSLAEALEQCGASDGVSFSDVHKIISVSFAKMTQIVADIATKQNGYAKIMGSSYSGAQMEVGPLKSAVTLARKIQTLTLPNHIRHGLYHERIWDDAENVCND